MKKLGELQCIPCEGGTPPLSEEQIQEYLVELKGEWVVQDGKKITKTFRFKDFAESMRFVNDIAAVAEKEGHHPNIKIVYNKVIVELTTHVMKGLSQNDFVVAAKIDAL